MIKTLHHTVTPYNDIKIVEDYPIRKMLFGSGICQEQSAINLVAEDHIVCDYAYLSLGVLLFNTNPKDILIAGLGGAVIPNQFYKFLSEVNIDLPKVNIDILELDPEVVSLSKQYFNFSESDRMKVYIGDAYSTISQLIRKYDVIILDVFNSNYIPFHIMSSEFLDKIRLIMKDKSVVAINTCNTHPSFYSHLNTIFNIFGYNLYKIDGPFNKLSSMIFATKGYTKNDKLPKLVIDEKILGAKIFSIKDFSAV